MSNNNISTYNTTNKFSRFIRLNEYCMAEYIFFDKTQRGESSEYEDYKMMYLNNKVHGVHQIYNMNDDIFVTNNVKKYLAIPYNGNRYAMFDEKNNVMLEYPDSNYLNEYYAAGSEEDTLSLIMDTVRFHFVAGYLVTAHDALICGVKNKENTGIYNLFLSAYLTSENYNDLIVFNPHPIYISDDKYDRYIDFKIPSIKDLNDGYYSGVPSRAVAASSLSDGGFVKDSPIIVFVDECNSTTVKKTEIHEFKFFNVDNHYEASVTQYNTYDQITADIHESTEGNYFEYGLKTTSGSVSNWFNLINTGGDKWSFIHQLNVYEHLRNGETYTCDTVTVYQANNFDELSKYRPVLDHAYSDVMVTIDYMVRIVNESTGEQIIRTSSCGSRNINAYGKNTLGISDLYKATPYKIYNKLFKTSISSTELYEEPSLERMEYDSEDDGYAYSQKIEYPVYIDRNKICVSDAILTSQSISDNSIIYNQYDLWILLDSIDNIFSFTIYKIESGKLVPYDLSINNSGIYYKLVFNIDNSVTMSIDPIDDDEISLKDGEIMFSISENEARQILESSSNDFYISAYNYSTMKNYPIYKGFWINSNHYDEYKMHRDKVYSDYEINSKNAVAIDDLRSEVHDPTESIPSDVYVPGYADQSSNSDQSIARSSDIVEK